LNVVNDVEFSKFIGIDDLDHYINSKCKSEILSDLVRWEIYKHDVAEQGFASSGDGFGVMKDGKSVVLGVNEGFLCSASVERVLKFREKEYEELGVRLAKRFVQAGLNVPKEVFVGWFGKGKG